jgi:hypothetical protein
LPSVIKLGFEQKLEKINETQENQEFDELEPPHHDESVEVQYADEDIRFIFSFHYLMLKVNGTLAQ